MSIEASSSPRPLARARLVAMEAGARQPVRELTEVITTLGSGDGCDVILSSNRLEAVHAAIVRTAGGAYLHDLGAPGGTSVNGRRIRVVRLTDGDVPSMGPFKFRVELEEAEGEPGASGPAFAVRNDKLIGLVTSEDGVLLIGSDAGCDVVLREAAVSPRHAMIVWTDAGPMVRDLQNRCRVRINGTETNSALISPGDTVGIGSHELTFELVPEAVCKPRRMAEEALGMGPSVRVGDDDGAGGLAAMPDLHALWPASLVMPRREPRPAPPAPSDTEAQEPGTNWRDQLLREAASVRESFTELREESEATDAAVPTEGPVHRMEALEERTAQLHERIIAAQNALDERARKIWQGLDQERERLRAYQAELQEKARLLIEAEEESGETAAAETKASEVDEAGRIAAIDALLDGKAEPRTAAEVNAAKTEAAANGREPVRAPIGRSDDDLEPQAAELVEWVRAERESMAQSEAQIETIHFDLERVRASLNRARQRHETQSREIAQQMRTLEATQIELRTERTALEDRLAQVERRQHQVEAALGEARRTHAELEAESGDVAKAQEDHDHRLQELRLRLEEERHRLSVRQSELQRKAAQLAHQAKTRRHAIEAELAQKQAELRAREAELRTQREQVERVGRSQLEQAATQLEEVLRVRIADVETEVAARRAELDAWVQSLASASVGTRERPAMFAPAVGGKLRTSAAAPTALGGVGAPQLTSLHSDLQEEVASLQKAMERMDAGIARALAAQAELGTKQPESAGDPLRWDAYGRPAASPRPTAPGGLSRPASSSADAKESAASESLRHWRGPLEGV